MEKNRINCEKCNDLGFYEVGTIFIVPCECEAGKVFKERKTEWRDCF